MSIWVALGAVVHFVGQAVGKSWDVTRDFVSWLFAIMPGPLKFFFFLYMIIFILSSIMPVFLGVGNSCDSFGDAYKINFVEIQRRVKWVENMAEICSGDSSGDLTFTDYLEAASDPVGVWEKTYYIIRRTWGIWTSWKTEDYSTLDPECAQFRELNYTNSTLSRDVVLQEWGEKTYQTGYQNVVHIGCSQNRDGEYFPSLNFYSVDLFNLEMWLLIGIAGLLIPLAFKWYRMIIK